MKFLETGKFQNTFVKYFVAWIKITLCTLDPNNNTIIFSTASQN